MRGYGAGRGDPGGPSLAHPALCGRGRWHGGGQADRLDLAEECQLFWWADVAKCPECGEQPGGRTMWSLGWQCGGRLAVTERQGAAESDPFWLLRSRPLQRGRDGQMDGRQRVLRRAVGRIL